MVQDSRKTPHTDSLKSVNAPEPVSVEEDSRGLLVALKAARRQTIAAVEDRWRLDDEWWRDQPVSRLYYAVLLASGQRLVLYKDLAGGKWYRQAY